MTAQLVQAPASQAAMLIRKPASEVFEAFVNPRITTQFWFTRGSGRLEAGSQVRWAWEMFDMTITVTAKVVEANRRIVIEWPGYSGQTTVEWTFDDREDGSTFVNVTETGFRGDAESLIKQVADSTAGFTLVLAGAKAWLEHGLHLNLVADRFPDGLEH